MKTNSSTLMLNLLVIIITVVLIAGLFLYLSRAKQKKSARFTKAVQAAGWQIEQIQVPLVSGYALSGHAAHVDWFLETKATASPRDAAPGSSEIGHFTRWWTTSISLPERNLLIGPSPPGLQVMGKTNGTLQQLAIKTLLGKDAGWVSGLSLVKIPHPVINEWLLCLADREQDVHRLLKTEVRRLLLLLPDKIQPVIKLQATGLEIVLPDMQLDNIEDVTAIIELGLSLVKSWRNDQPD